LLQELHVPGELGEFLEIEQLLVALLGLLLGLELARES